MAKKNTAQRAAKKHEKEKKRKKKLQARPPRVVERDPVDDWRPAIEGIEGLAHRLNVGSHDAAHLAELVATHGRRADAAATWLPTKVRALTDEQILAELAARGVTTDEASFAAAAEMREGARDLAIELWKPMMRPDADVHDRDFVGEAAVALWERWAPHRVSDEVLLDLLRGAFEDPGTASEDVRLDALCATWELARDNGGLARLARIDDRGAAFLEELLHVLDGAGPVTTATERGLTVLGDVRRSFGPEHESHVHAVVVEARILERLGRPAEALTRLVAAAPATPNDGDVLGEAVEIFRANPDVPRWHGEDIQAALKAVQEVGTPELRAIRRDDLDAITELLSSR